MTIYDGNSRNNKLTCLWSFKGRQQYPPPPTTVESYCLYTTENVMWKSDDILENDSHFEVKKKYIKQTFNGIYYCKYTIQVITNLNRLILIGFV